MANGRASCKLAFSSERPQAPTTPPISTAPTPAMVEAVALEQDLVTHAIQMLTDPQTIDRLLDDIRNLFEGGNENDEVVLPLLMAYFDLLRARMRLRNLVSGMADMLLATMQDRIVGGDDQEADGLFRLGALR